MTVSTGLEPLLAAEHAAIYGYGIAGARNVKIRGRTLGFVALASGVVSMASCYCVPTALALGIWSDKSRIPEETRAKLAPLIGKYL